MKKDTSRPKRVPVKELSATSFSVVVALPPAVFQGIGKVISAHACLELMALELIFELMRLNYPEGRVGIRYVSAVERFKTAVRLLDLHGITPSMDLGPLEKRILRCCDARDQLAHGIWWAAEDGGLRLRLTKGEYDTPQGKASRTAMPVGAIVPDAYYDQAMNAAIQVALEVQALKEEVKSHLQTPPPGPS